MYQCINVLMYQWLVYPCSWGEDWGENGYIRVSRDPSQSMCKITQAPVYPEVTYVAMGERDSDDIYAEKDDGQWGKDKNL